MERNLALNRIDHAISWGLLTLFLAMTVSGYMLTKGFIDRYWGFIAHNELAIPTMALFSIHFAIRLRFFLMRWRVKEGLALNLISLLVGIALFLPVLYLDLFFQMS